MSRSKDGLDILGLWCRNLLGGSIIALVSHVKNLSGSGVKRCKPTFILVARLTDFSKFVMVIFGVEELYLGALAFSA